MADTTPSFLAICKKEFVPITGDNDELPISNIGALRMGMEAMAKEDAGDFERSERLWAKADKLLTNESQDDEGAGAQGAIQVDDTFDVASIGGCSI